VSLQVNITFLESGVQRYEISFRECKIYFK